MKTKQERYNEKMRRRDFAKKEKANRDRENTPEAPILAKLKPIRAYSGHYTQREYWRNLGARKKKA